MRNGPLAESGISRREKMGANCVVEDLTNAAPRRRGASWPALIGAVDWRPAQFSAGHVPMLKPHCLY
jgi:hypothetical protein